MRSPRRRASARLSNTALTITSASRRENRGYSTTNSSIRPRLVTVVASLGFVAVPLHRRAAWFLTVQPQIRAQDVLEREATTLALALQIRLDLLAFLGLAQCLDAERDLAIARIDRGHLGLDLLVGGEHRLRLVDALGAELRHVDQPLDALLDLHEDAKVGDAGDLAAHARAERIALVHALPRVLGELLDAERDAFVVDVDAEHDRFHLVALLEQLGGMAHLFGPVQIGDVHQPVDALLDADEDPEVGEVLHLPLDAAADRMIDAHHLPGIRLRLLEAERDAPVRGIDVEHHDVDFLADLEHLRRMGDALGPRHLRDVHQPFDAGLELDEGAVIGEADDLAVHARADRIPFGDARPGIRPDLFHDQRHAPALGIVLEHHDAHPVTDVDYVGRLVHPTPR